MKIQEELRVDKFILLPDYCSHCAFNSEGGTKVTRRMGTAH